LVEDINLKTTWIFTPESGTYSVSMKNEHVIGVAVSSSAEHPLSTLEESFGGFAYLLTRVNGSMRFWRYDSPKGFNCVEFDPTDDRVIFGNDDGNVYVFDLDGSLVSTVKLGAPVYSCAFSPFGNKVAVATESEEGSKITIMDKNFEHLWEYLTDDNVWGLSWHEEEEMLAVASHDGNVYILKKPTAIWKEEVAEAVNKVKWCGNKLVVGTFKPGAVILYDTHNPENPEKVWEIDENLSNVWGLDFNDLCDIIAYGDATVGKMALVDLDGNEIISTEFTGGVQSLSWKGSTIVVATDKIKALSVVRCHPISSMFSSLERVTTISLKWDNDTIEISSVLHSLLGKPGWLYVNNKLLKTSVVRGNHLYVRSPLEGEVELRVPKGVQY